MKARDAFVTIRGLFPSTDRDTFETPPLPPMHRVGRQEPPRGTGSPRGVLLPQKRVAMSLQACFVCRHRIIGHSLTAYHRWWEGDVSQAWKQKAHIECGTKAWAALFKYARESSDIDADVPTSCTNCGGTLPTVPNVIYHSFFTGKSRRDLVGVLCDDDLLIAAPICIDGGVRLADRADAGGGGSGGAVASGEDVLASLGRVS